MAALGKLRKARWSENALALIEKTLRPAADFDAAGFVRDGVQSGRMELWNVNDHSAAVTEFIGDTLRVHAYQGKDVTGFAKMFCHIGQTNGCKRATFHCDTPGLLRQLASFKPRALGGNEYEVQL